MAGKVVVSTLNNDTGVLATQNGMTGIAKAWVNFNGTGTVAIRDSFNVSSITDNGTGDYTVNFTTAMPNANYAVAGFSNHQIGSAPDNIFGGVTTYPTATKTTSALRFNTVYITASSTAASIGPFRQDQEQISIAIFSS